MIYFENFLKKIIDKEQITENLNDICDILNKKDKIEQIKANDYFSWNIFVDKFPVENNFIIVDLGETKNVMRIHFHFNDDFKKKKSSIFKDYFQIDIFFSMEKVSKIEIQTNEDLLNNKSASLFYNEYGNIEFELEKINEKDFFIRKDNYEISLKNTTDETEINEFKGSLLKVDNMRVLKLKNIISNNELISLALSL